MCPLRSSIDPQDQRRQDVQNGWWVIKKYNCVGCHQIQVGQRSVLMDVPLYQTPEGKDLLPPRLTSEGARVDPNWLLRFLNDPSLSEPERSRRHEPASCNSATACCPNAPQATEQPNRHERDRNATTAGAKTESRNRDWIAMACGLSEGAHADI